MFEHKIPFTYIFIMVDDQMPQTDTGIKIKVLHGQRFLKDIPKSLLSVLDKQVSIERQFAFCQSLGDTQLKLHVRIGSSRFMSESCPSHEVIVLEQGEIRHLVQNTADTVGVISIRHDPFPDSFSFFSCAERVQTITDRNRSITILFIKRIKFIESIKTLAKIYESMNDNSPL